ncbi:MAG: hypothetical protein ACFFD4_36210 [Candidatus Odinarchaeota archaeon]
MVNGELTLSDAFTSWLNAGLYPFVDAYGHLLDGFPLNFFSYIFSALLLALFMQVLFSIFPPLKSLVDAIMFPFRIVHIWLHVQEARKIIKKRQERDYNDDFSLAFTTLFTTGFGTKTEKPIIALSGTCTPREASRIANAPIKGVLAFLLLLTILTPVFRISFIGKTIHLYMFIGIATTSFPSASDYKYTYNMLLLNSQVSISWLLSLLAGFSVVFAIVIIGTSNLVFALIGGLASSSLCTWLLMTGTSWITNKNSSRTNKESSSTINASSSTPEDFHVTTTEINTASYLYELKTEY